MWFCVVYFQYNNKTEPSGYGHGYRPQKQCLKTKHFKDFKIIIFYISLSTYMIAFIYFIQLACTKCEDLFPFLGASSIPLCYIPFPSTLFHQLVFHLPSIHLAIYFLVYLSALLFPDPHITFFVFGILFSSTLYTSNPT